MKKEVTLVPKDKCPLDVLADMEERTADAWIYFHENAVKKLEKSCDIYEEIFILFIIVPFLTRIVCIKYW